MELLQLLGAIITGAVFVLGIYGILWVLDKLAGWFVETFL